MRGQGGPRRAGARAARGAGRGRADARRRAAGAARRAAPLLQPVDRHALGHADARQRRLRLRVLARLPAHDARGRAAPRSTAAAPARADHSSPTTPPARATTPLGPYGWVEDARPGAPSVAALPLPAPRHRPLRLQRRRLRGPGERGPARLRARCARTRSPRYYNGADHWVTTGAVGGASRSSRCSASCSTGRHGPPRALRVRERRRPLPVARPGLRGPARSSASPATCTPTRRGRGRHAALPLPHRLRALRLRRPRLRGPGHEGLLGYAPHRRSVLNRAYNPSTAPTGSRPAPIAAGLVPRVLARLRADPRGRRPPSRCSAASRRDRPFLSLDARLRGPAGARHARAASTPPRPPASPTAPVYRCLTGGDHFASIDPGCEGHTREAPARLRPLRRARSRPPPPPRAAALHVRAVGREGDRSLRGRKVRRIRYGGSSTVAGRVRNAGRQPVAGARRGILIGNRKPLVLGDVVTGPDGRYSFRVRPGKNRILHAGFRPSADSPRPRLQPQRAPQRPRGDHACARPSACRRGGRVRFRGRLLGKPIPRVGKLIDLQAYDAGRWRTFKTVRANRKGRYRASLPLRAHDRAADVPLPRAGPPGGALPVRARRLAGRAGAGALRAAATCSAW